MIVQSRLKWPAIGLSWNSRRSFLRRVVSRGIYSLVPWYIYNPSLLEMSWSSGSRYSPYILRTSPTRSSGSWFSSIVVAKWSSVEFPSVILCEMSFNSSKLYLVSISICFWAVCAIKYSRSVLLSSRRRLLMSCSPDLIRGCCSLDGPRL
jgi:hypothetical protein